MPQDTEIKSAYRKLVKRYHPDVNKDQHEGKIKQLNEAYDILSDPARKAAYDGRFNGFAFEHVENPREVLRREYKARKREEHQRRREEYMRWAGATYKVLWFVAIAGFIFASLIVIDRYLPQYEYYEVAETGWQENGPRSSRELVSFMQTQHFVIAVPNEIYISYDYQASDKQPLTITVSPIFSIPSTVSLTEDGRNYSAEIQRTIFSGQLKLQYWLLMVSLLVVLKKDYSNFNFTVALFPVFLLLFIWTIYF